MSDKICQNCGATMKFVPAGVSKKTGNSYKAFYSCACGKTAPSIQREPQNSSWGKVTPEYTGGNEEIMNALREVYKELVALRKDFHDFVVVFGAGKEEINQEEEKTI